MALKFFRKIRICLYFLAGVSIIFFVGSIYTYSVTKKEEKKIVDEMFVLTKTFAKTIDAQRFRTLKENFSDTSSQDYLYIRKKLIDIASINKSSGIRWIYTMAKNDGNIVFSVDSIPSDSVDYSDPGDFYTDASSEFVDYFNKALKDGSSFATKPYTDRWGTFVSIITPITDVENNEIIGILASDMDYNLFYTNRLNEAKKLPVATLIYSEILFSIIFFYVIYLIRDKKELLEKNIILKQYVNHVPGMFFQFQMFKNGKSSMPYVSKKIWDILEIKKEEVVEDASKIFDKISKDDIDEVRASIKESMDMVSEWNHEFRVILSSGIKWLSVRSKPERLLDGSFLWYGYISDITEHKEMELEMERRADKIQQEILEIENVNSKLKENKEAMVDLTMNWEKTQEILKSEGFRINTIISSMGEALLIIDRQYKIILINPKALDIIGYQRNEVFGKDLRDILKITKNKKDLPLSDWPTEVSFETNKIITTVLEDDLYIRTDEQKEPIAVTFSIAPLSGELENDTNKQGLVVIIRDANKDKELDKAKSGFISIASHQLRTPLTSIRWYAEMLLSGSYGVLSESQQDLAKEIHNGVSRLYQTINVLLGISRIESGNADREKVPIDLTKITSEVIKELSPIMVEKKLVYFSFSAQTDSIIVKLDPVTLRQVILNLFANSIRYTNNNGTIEGRWLIDKEKNEVIYSVRDNGIGIPKNSQDKIFSKFYRADNAMLKVPDGTGLGLAFVKDVVASWGGRVWFETEENKGSTFFFTIPILKE